MIISNQKYKTQPNGKNSYRGFINLTKDVSAVLGREEQEVVIILMEEGEELSVEKFEKSLSKLKRYAELKQELQQIRGELSQ
jgi:hypothetical protein|tara:strand:- start:10012 stop:10257 length:246 start_codon:yes stop_codon:yes gene_type:complete